MKKALITGITGQDGSYMAELLLRKGYDVHGIVRRSSTFNRGRIDHLLADHNPHRKHLHLHYGDLNDTSSLLQILQKVKPDEIYNYAAQSHVKISFEIPEYTAEVDALGALRVLEAMREMAPEIKFYQASTSELFGVPVQVPQTEETPFIPQSPYSAAKLYAFWLCKIYKEAYGLYVTNGILFNHESPRRGENFITRKVTLGAARAKLGERTPLQVGNIYAIRDWGYAPDFVYGVWKIMTLNKPEDFVLATGEGHTVKELIDYAYQAAGLDLEWEGENEKEQAFFKTTGQVAVQVNPAYYRPLEVKHLLGNPEKAARLLEWRPQVKFHRLVELMYAADFALLSKDPHYKIDQPIWPE